MSRVAIVRGTNPLDMTIKALEMIDAAKVVPADKPVLIKPNYINTRHPSTGITTDARIIEGVVAFLKKGDSKEVIIGEGTGSGDTLDAFKIAGVDDVARRWRARMIDLNKGEFVEVHPPNARTLRKVKISKIALESTIISVPKLKPHRLTGVTLSLKNMMGAMTPKGSMHTHLSQNIVDLASVIKPSIAVVDGIIAGEGHETSGNPVEMNLVIAGTDPVAVDTIGAAVMGIPPEHVKHLQLAQESGLGTCILERIEVVGEPVQKVQRNFRTSFLAELAELVRV